MGRRLILDAEYRVGIELADTASRAAERPRALVAITSAVDVLDYTQATAAHHGRRVAPVPSLTVAWHPSPVG